jgi:hypothetical protein
LEGTFWGNGISRLGKNDEGNSKPNPIKELVTMNPYLTNPPEPSREKVIWNEAQDKKEELLKQAYKFIEVMDEPYDLDSLELLADQFRNGCEQLERITKFYSHLEDEFPSDWEEE